MKTRDVLCQLFGAIFAGITIGVLVGYRINWWAGLLVGTGIACVSADITHAWATFRMLATAFQNGIKKGLGMALAVTDPSRFASCGESFVWGIATLFYLAIFGGGTILGLTSIDFLVPDHFRHKGDGEFVDIILSSVYFEFFTGMFALVSCGLIAELMRKVKSERFIRLPLLRLLVLTCVHWIDSLSSKKAKTEKKEKVHENEEDTPKELLRLRLRYEDGNIIRKAEFMFLLVSAAAVAILPWAITMMFIVAILGLAVLFLDGIATGLLALANRRNTTAGYSTATGILLWFLLFPEFGGTALEVIRLLGFATGGGLIGVGLYMVREKLLAIPVPTPEQTIASTPSA